MLTGKRIVITGAAGGIGREILKELERGDNKILAVDLKTDGLEGFDPEKVFPFECDVGAAEGVDAIFAEAERRFGGIDVFHANAGFAYYERMDRADWGRIERLLTVNAVSPVYSFQKFQRHIGDREGIFAFTVSAIGQFAMPGWALYGMSKHALNGFQEAARLEAKKNLHITCLYPVATDTDFYAKANSREYRRPWPMQKPDVVARAFVKGLERKKKSVYPYRLWPVLNYLTRAFPFLKPLARSLEMKKLREFVAASEKEKGEKAEA